MRSLLGPALGNIFLCKFAIKWLQNDLDDFKFVFCRRYVNAIFALFSSPD